MEDLLIEFFPFILGLISVLVAFLFWKRSRNLEEEETAEEESQEADEKSEESTVKTAAPKSKKAAPVKRKEVKDTFTHPWLIASLKGHSGEISDLDFSSNGKQLASCAEDRAVMLWSVKTFTEKNHRSVRANIEFDYATRIKWSPDSKAFIVSTATGNTIQVYKVGKKSDGSLGNVEMILKFPEKHIADIINIGIACNGHFIMSCSSDTSLTIWDLKGEVLTTIDTLHMNNYYACVSPCGRFVASSGFTPDVRELNHYASPIASDIRVQQDARAAVVGMSQRYPYAITPTSNYVQPTDRLQPSVMDAKVEQKLINDISKIVHDTRVPDEKSHHPVKSGRIKKEEKDKIMHPERDDHEGRHIPAHEKIPPTSALASHSLRQQQHGSHYSPTIRHTVSPHEQRITNSPIIPNTFANGQGRVPPIPISAQIDDHKLDGLSLSSQHYKGETPESKTPPVAHQAPLSLPYHSLGVMPKGSPTIDIRSFTPAHSPSSHSYKKDSSHNQLVSSLHNPATEKRLSAEHSKKVVHRTHTQQGSSISPGPVGIAPAHSPSWHIQSLSAHSPMPPSPHVILSTNEQSGRRVNPHMTPQLGAEVPPPPPAHAGGLVSQPSNVPRNLPQTSPPPPPPLHLQPPGQVPGQDAYILRRYPVMWMGLLALKNEHSAVQMHFVTGNANIARLSLPPIVDGETAPVRIRQRMRLDPQQLEGVFRKIQMTEEHCILMALPCGKDQKDLVQQSSNLKTGFISYLLAKKAAGIVNAAAPDSQQPVFVIHIFPSCEFTDSNLARIAPNLLSLVNDISHLVIIIATV